MKKLAKQNIVLNTGTKLYRSGLAFLLSLVVLTGCSRTETRTLVVCKETADELYVYDNDLNTYIMKESTAIPIRSAGLIIKPALSIIDTDSDYTLVKISEGKYESTVSDVSAYVSYLKKLSYEFVLVERSADYLECYLNNAEMSVRIIFTSDNIAHIYGKSSDGKYCDPPYLNGKE